MTGLTRLIIHQKHILKKQSFKDLRKEFISITVTALINYYRDMIIRIILSKLQKHHYNNS